MSHFDRGDFDRVLLLKEDVLRTFAKRFNLRWYTFALSITSRAYGYLGRWEEAVTEAHKALSVAEEFSDNSLISFVAWNLSIVYTRQGDSDMALKYGELAVQKAPTPGDKAWGQRSLGWAWCRAGEPKRGIELLTGVLPIFRAGGFIVCEIPIACYLGEGYFLAGEEVKARQMLEEGLEMAEQCGMRYYAGFAQRLLGKIILKTNPGQSLSHFEKSIAIFQEIKADNELAITYTDFGHLHKQHGQIAQAQGYLNKALEIFERLGTLSALNKIKKELAVFND
jgi:tetratricopeptide (TPR) repeat protein